MSLGSQPEIREPDGPSRLLPGCSALLYPCLPLWSSFLHTSDLPEGRKDTRPSWVALHRGWRVLAGQRHWTGTGFREPQLFSHPSPWVQPPHPKLFCGPDLHLIPAKPKLASAFLTHHFSFSSSLYPAACGSGQESSAQETEV